LKYIDESKFKFQKYLHNSINEKSGKIGVLLIYSNNNDSIHTNDFSKNICMHIAATDPKAKDIDSLDKILVDKEKLIYTEQLKSSNKPNDIVAKIIEGKVKKYYEEVCLLEQIFVIDNKTKIKNSITDFNKEHKDDFNIVDYFVFKLGQE